MIESHAIRTDEEVDAILKAVETTSNFLFAYNHRCALWKALRYRWFQSPEYAKSFISGAEVPRLVLPKKDFRIRDNGIDMKNLDSERQRMIVRKTVFDEQLGTTVIQQDVYRRHSHLLYELTGLERTMQFWMSQDPRKMAREDPREEVVLNQTKAIELDIAASIDRLKLDQKVKRLVHRVFFVIKILFFLAFVLFLALAGIDATSGSDNRPELERFISKSYIRCSCLYLTTFWFISEATKKRGKMTLLDLAKRMHANCRMMYSDMISFRLKTHFIRQDKIPRFLDEAQNGEGIVRSGRQEDISAAKSALMSGVFDEYFTPIVASARVAGRSMLADLPSASGLRSLPTREQMFTTTSRSVMPDDGFGLVEPDGDYVSNIAVEEVPNRGGLFGSGEEDYGDDEPAQTALELFALDKEDVVPDSRVAQSQSEPDTAQIHNSYDPLRESNEET